MQTYTGEVTLEREELLYEPRLPSDGNKMGFPKSQISTLRSFSSKCDGTRQTEIEVYDSACPVSPLSSNLASGEKSCLRLERVQVQIWTILMVHQTVKKRSIPFFPYSPTSTCLHSLLTCSSIDSFCLLSILRKMNSEFLVLHLAFLSVYPCIPYFLSLYLTSIS